MVTDIETFQPKEYKFGWQFEYCLQDIPRIVFRKKDRSGDSLCFFYFKQELTEHFSRKCLTSLEYLEGLDFCTQRSLPTYKETALIAIQPRDQYNSEGASIVITNK